MKYDMSSKENREITVSELFPRAQTHRSEQEKKWNEIDRYYLGEHYTKEQVIELAQRYGWDFVPPVLPDPFIQVESQVNDIVPTFQFKGRDGNLDPLKAKIRESIVNYVLYNNNIDILNLENDRTRLKFGDSFYKVSFDKDKMMGMKKGDIVIGNPHVMNIFPDPSACSVDDCEYIGIAYQIHWLKARRKWGKILDEIGTDNKSSETTLESNRKSYDDDTVQVIEWWYRDNDGDIACSIQINNKEVQFIKKYWEKTRLSGNKMYPLVQLYNIPISQSFWNRGEIEGIIDLTEAGNRELMSALLNDMFNGSDVIVATDGAFPMGEQPQLIPGTKWDIPKGESVTRLGQTANNANAVNMASFIHDKIQETNGNFANKGKEPARVTTASGLAQLREDRNERLMVKSAGRLFGYKQLAKLIDWTALEFFDTDRVFTLQGQEGAMAYNSNMFKIQDTTIDYRKESEELAYYPQIDVEISAGSGIQKSKVMTLSVVERLLNITITPQNATFVKMYIDTLDVPNKKEINDEVDRVVTEIKGQQQESRDINIDEVMDSLTDEEKEAFYNMSEEEQIQLLEQTIGQQ